MITGTTVTTVSHFLIITCDVTVITTTDANINAITNIVTSHQIIIQTIHTVTDLAVDIAVTVMYECRAGGRNGIHGTCIVSKVFICVFFLGYTSLKCGCFPTRD